MPAAADHAAPGATGLVLVHGSWCGAWAWGLVEPHQTAAGLRVLAIDLPGHGLHARLPEPFLHRPLDAEAFAAAPSAMAGIGAAELAAAVAGAARRLRAAGARRVVAVGHSMGGVPVSHAAARWPALFDGLIYLAAYAALPGKAPAAHLRLPEQVARGLLPGICVGDARHIGALRIDPRSEDPGYLARMAEALGDDLPAELMAVVRHLMTPDAPALIYREQAAFDPAAAAHSRSYVRCAARPHGAALDRGRHRRRHDRGLARPPLPAGRSRFGASADVLLPREAGRDPGRAGARSVPRPARAAARPDPGGIGVVQRIAGAAHGADRVASRRAGRRLAQPADMDVDGARRRRRRHCPRRGRAAVRG
ncbi:MAG: esterase [Paracoccaceae bacterium]|nr:MAG: esterase [Paracoccaceae bacterium]